MPEKLAPGVYVEETSFRSKSIEGVSTTTAGFVGPVRYGPIGIEPEIITSLAEFERAYGDRNPLKFSAMDGTPLKPMHNYLWHAVRAFFEEGGKRLYVSRIFSPIGERNDGCADVWIPESAENGIDTIKEGALRVRARFPGELGKMRVRLTLQLGQNIFGMEAVEHQGEKPGLATQFRQSVKSLVDGDLVCISQSAGSPSQAPEFYIAKSHIDGDTKEITWSFTQKGVMSSPTNDLTLSIALYTAHIDESKKVTWVRDEESSPLPLYSLDPNRHSISILSMAVTVFPAQESDFSPIVYEGLPLDPEHKRADQPDSLFALFAPQPANIGAARRSAIVVEAGKDVSDGLTFLNILFSEKQSLRDALTKENATELERSFELLLDGGNDGQRPGSAEYEGAIDAKNRRTGLKVFEDLDDISIVAAPGVTFGFANNPVDASATVNALVTHATKMRHRIAIIDPGDDQSISQVRDMRAKLDSSYAALYYPWVRILDPITKTEINLPPSGFVAGIYARNDTKRGVYKAPSNEVVNLAIGFETLLNRSQQEVLNSEGINSFRYFEGRGFRLWGAHTASSDPEWKYVNLRRYVAYLEHSIEKGTQWAVFEPNRELLWGNIRRTVENFLLNEWKIGALLGDKPEKAYFVRCDRSTMTQNDLDNGRMICLVGVAPLRPAEFVIFRIGQWTADQQDLS